MIRAIPKPWLYILAAAITFGIGYGVGHHRHARHHRCHPGETFFVAPART